jgi:hypothetical protein
MSGMQTYMTRTRRWTRIEYEKLIDLGIFRPGEPIELLGGDLNAHHAAMGALVALITLLVAGCATAAPPPSTAGGEPKSTSAIKRCSPSDPDRHAWFCVIGQILYGVAGAMQPDGGYSLR